MQTYLIPLRAADLAALGIQRTAACTVTLRSGRDASPAGRFAAVEPIAACTLKRQSCLQIRLRQGGELTEPRSTRRVRYAAAVGSGADRFGAVPVRHHVADLHAAIAVLVLGSLAKLRVDEPEEEGDREPHREAVLARLTGEERVDDEERRGGGR